MLTANTGTGSNFMRSHSSHDFEVLVANKRMYRGEGFYIGRSGSKPSPLANPYTHLPGLTNARFKVANRKASIDCYERWVKQEMGVPKVAAEFTAMVKELRDKKKIILICHCVPETCHGDVLAKMLLEEVTKPV